MLNYVQGGGLRCEEEKMRKKKKESISARLTLLMERLNNLESKQVEPHEESIKEIGLTALKDKIRELGKQLDAC